MNPPLALHGDTPAITEPAPHFTWPPTTDTTMRAVFDQLTTSISIPDRSGIIERLEDKLAAYHGVRHAVLTSSGTAALHSTYAACELEPGDEVIVPAYTFFATATPLLHLGAVPVLAECDDDGNLDPADAATRITPRTRAIVVTHLWGMPANMDGLTALAAEHELLLLEDASHAHGARIGERKVGTFGDAAAFSLNGPKPLSAGEGGFVLTNDDELFYRLLLHGQYNKRCRTEIPNDHPLYAYAVTGMGLKHRIHPLAAVIAEQQLGRLDEYLAGRAITAAYLCEELGDLLGLVAPEPRAGAQPSWYALALQYQPEELEDLPVERFYDALRAEGCAEVDRPGSTCPLNLHPLFQEPGALFPEYKGVFSYSPGDFPIAETIYQRTLKLPVWHHEDDRIWVRCYVEALRKVTMNYQALLG